MNCCRTCAWAAGPALSPGRAIPSLSSFFSYLSFICFFFCFLSFLCFFWSVFCLSLSLPFCGVATPEKHQFQGYAWAPPYHCTTDVEFVSWLQGRHGTATNPVTAPSLTSSMPIRLGCGDSPSGRATAQMTTTAATATRHSRLHKHTHTHISYSQVELHGVQIWMPVHSYLRIDLFIYPSIYVSLPI